jgi:hypothetical protein
MELEFDTKRVWVDEDEDENRISIDLVTSVEVLTEIRDQWRDVEMGDLADALDQVIKLRLERSVSEH